MSNSQKTKAKRIKPVKERYTAKNAILNCYLLAVFTVFPLFVNLTLDLTFPFLHFDSGYILIRHQKYFFFLVLTAIALIAELMLLATNATAEKKESDPGKQHFLKTLSFTDWAVLAFVFSCALSTVFSPYIDMAVAGEFSVGNVSHGRNNGLVLMLAYAVIYFMVTRCWKYKEYVFIGLAAAGGIVSLLAVLNGFYIDPLNMFEKFVNDENVYNNFMTTIGNKNMFSSHLCVVLPVTVAMFVYTDRLWCKAVYLGSAFIGAMALVVCDSDSATIGMGVFIAVSTVVYLRRLEKLKLFLLALTVMLTGAKLLNLFAYLSDGHYKELSAVPFRVMTSEYTYFAIAALALLTAAAFVADYLRRGKQLPAAFPVIAGVLFGLAALSALGVILYFSLIDTKSDLGDMEKTLRFSDAWGTHRGFMWNKSFEAYGQYNLWQKLFGTGPETFYYTFSPYFGELYEEFGDTSTDAAHNEYINYLMNIGIVGLCSYLAFTGGALVRALRAAKRNPIAIVFASAVVTYMAQAIVNIALPIATPLFIIFVALCEAVAREKQPDNQ